MKAEGSFKDSESRGRKIGEVEMLRVVEVESGSLRGCVNVCVRG